MPQTLYVGHWDIKVSIMQAAYKLRGKTREQTVNQKTGHRCSGAVYRGMAEGRILSPERDLAVTSNASAEHLCSSSKEKAYNQQRNFKFHFIN